MTGLSAAAACTRGCASTSVGKRCSSEICRMAVGCSDGAAEVSSGTVWHDRRVVSAPPVELLLAKIGLSAAEFDSRWRGYLLAGIATSAFGTPHPPGRDRVSTES